MPRKHETSPLSKFWVRALRPKTSSKEHGELAKSSVLRARTERMSRPSMERSLRPICKSTCESGEGVETRGGMMSRTRRNACMRARAHMRAREEGRGAYASCVRVPCMCLCAWRLARRRDMHWPSRVLERVTALAYSSVRSQPFARRVHALR
eukprot:1041412-Pleurochrysis_carterae.AAC.1